MAEHLQGLLNKIQEEGVRKAEAERNEILREAEEKAKRIVADARKEADQLRKQAEADAAALQQRAESAVRQASRDVLLALQSELEKRMNAILQARAGEGMTPDFVARLLDGIAASYKADPKNLDSDRAAVLVNPKQLGELESRVKAELANHFRIKAELFADRGIKAGIKVGFSGDDVFFDCTDQAVAELLSTYLSPKLAALLANASVETAKE